MPQLYELVSKITVNEIAIKIVRPSKEDLEKIINNALGFKE